jgi:hypothetical protein
MNEDDSFTVTPDASKYAQEVWEDESPAQEGQLQLIRQKAGGPPKGYKSEGAGDPHEDVEEVEVVTPEPKRQN